MVQKGGGGVVLQKKGDGEVRENDLELESLEPVQQRFLRDQGRMKPRPGV